MEVDPAIVVLFGRDRSRVLGVLANSSVPLTGYAISRLSGSQRIKVSAELGKLAAASLVKAVGSGKVRRLWTLTDPGLCQFFRERVRIVSSQELRSRAERAALSEPEAVRWANSVDLRGLRPSSKVNLSEFRRPVDKDRALRRAGLRPSRRAR